MKPVAKKEAKTGLHRNSAATAHTVRNSAGQVLGQPVEPKRDAIRLSTGSVRIDGRLLTEGDFRRQAREAEVEPSDALIERLLARQAGGESETRRGRPSLGRGRGTSAHLQIRVDDELNQKIHERAEREGKKISEVVRDILRKGV